MRIPALLLFTLISSFFAITSPAQTTGAPAIGSISGKLTDTKGTAVSYATVTLLKTDSSVVNGDLSKDDGSFSIAPTGLGSFLLRIESMGMGTKFVSVQVTTDAPDKNLGKIKLTQTESTLGEVDVVGEKPIMELKVDKKVFNVDKNTTTAGGSAADVLQNVPSVSVDVDGNVSLRGKSDVTILIDGKPSTLLGTDVASALQSLPAGSIESVEVITNPSAKYDAQGSTGIINIVTRKDGRFGLNGNATLGAGTHDKYNGNLGLNARKGKWTVFLNSSFRLHKSYNDVTTTRYNKDSLPGLLNQYQNFHTYENVPHTFNGYFNTIGASFDPDKNNSITLTENINKMDFNFQDYSNYNVYNNTGYNNIVGQGTPYLQETRTTNQGGGPLSVSTALDYTHKFKKKDEELNLDATFAYNTRTMHQYYLTNVDTLNTTSNHIVPGYPNITENAPGTSTNSSFNAWADYTDPLFTKNGKLGLGFKTQLYWFNNTNNPIIDTQKVNPDAGIPDNSLLAKYNYTQQIHAGYVNWNDQLGRFGYQVGVRVEDEIYNGYGYVPAYATFQHSFINPFPSAFVSYKLDDQQSIYLNYSRRTDRPGFRQLLPFVDVSNPGTVNTGNPGLLPEFINNVEFSYSRADKKGNNFILSAYYAYTQNLIQSVTTPLTQAQADTFGVTASELLSKPVNIASGTTYGAEGTGHFQLLPIWDLTANVNLFENQLVIGNANPSETKYLSGNNGFTWFGKINSNLKLPKNFSFQVNVNYTSPQIISQGTLQQTWWMDLALRKTLWKNKATIVVNCSDVFNTHHFITNFNQGTYNETINRVKETRVGNLTFTYRFGKSDIGNKAGKHGKPDEAKPLVPTDEDRTKNLKQGGGDDNGGGDQPAGGGQKQGGGGTGAGAGH